MWTETGNFVLWKRSFISLLHVVVEEKLQRYFLQHRSPSTVHTPVPYCSSSPNIAPYFTFCIPFPQYRPLPQLNSLSQCQQSVCVCLSCICPFVCSLYSEVFASISPPLHWMWSTTAPAEDRCSPWFSSSLGFDVLDAVSLLSMKFVPIGHPA